MKCKMLVLLSYYIYQRDNLSMKQTCYLQCCCIYQQDTKRILQKEGRCSTFLQDRQYSLLLMWTLRLKNNQSRKNHKMC